MTAPDGIADFDGWATVANVKCSDGRVIARQAFEQNDGAVVPLVWQHGHDNVTNVWVMPNLKRSRRVFTPMVSSMDLLRRSTHVNSSSTAM